MLDNFAKQIVDDTPTLVKFYKKEDDRFKFAVDHINDTDFAYIDIDNAQMLPKLIAEHFKENNKSWFDRLVDFECTDVDKKIRQAASVVAVRSRLEWPRKVIAHSKYKKAFTADGIYMYKVYYAPWDVVYDDSVDGIIICIDSDIGCGLHYKKLTNGKIRVYTGPKDGVAEDAFMNSYAFLMTNNIEV